MQEALENSSPFLEAPDLELDPDSVELSGRAKELYESRRHQVFCDTDRMFAYLMIFQYIACVVWAYFGSPATWAGAVSSPHPHLYSAVILGGAITLFPAFLAFKAPGATLTRYVISIAQMLVSALLIHISGGRIETHFHIFGSLAFISFYRDWRLFIPATIVVALDHLIRGIYFPLSVYGVVAVSPWRSLEHSLWVIFENIFLIRSCFRATRAIKLLAMQQAALEEHNHQILDKVKRRTAERNQLRDAVKGMERVLSVVGHELRTPLASMQMMTEYLLGMPNRNSAEFTEFLSLAHQESRQMADDLNKLLEIARLNSSTSEWSWGEFEVSRTCKEAADKVMPMIDGKQIRFGIEAEEQNMKGDPAAIERLLVNLLENACQHTVEGSISLRAIAAASGSLKFEVSDTGSGIDPDLIDRVGVPFALNQGMAGLDHIQGAGFGLAICRGIAGAHGGYLTLDSTPGRGTTITVLLKTDLNGPAPAEQIVERLYAAPS